MKKERWRLYAKKADFVAISKAYGINQVTARIMRNRGVETKEEIESYLKGDLDYLSDPALMKDADKAASLLEVAIANNELIAISSDFDNDGIFSGLLLKEAIIELGGRAAIFTPNRVMEGYGVNSRIVEEANAKGASVLLTCDNGIAAFEAIDEANDLIEDEIETDIQGYDIDGSVVRMARENAENAGVAHLIHFQERAVKDLRHPKKYGFIITNPPYGERLEDRETLPQIYREFGESFKGLDNWSAYMITSFEDAERYFGRKADKNRKIYNGMLKTYFYQFQGPKPPRQKR